MESIKYSFIVIDLRPAWERFTNCHNSHVQYDVISVWGRRQDSCDRVGGRSGGSLPTGPVN
jgi:hypothetical protein